MYVAELFPTRYRLRGTAVCATAGRVATALVQLAVVAIFAWQGLMGVLLTLAGSLVFQAIVFLLFGIETKGRALEEISAIAAVSGPGPGARAAAASMA
jgi:MFS transporter, putative metabolite:H+ symporter